MLRLIEAHLPSAGKPDVGDRSPPCFLHLRTADALPVERHYLGLQIVAHEVELMSTILFGGMNGHLRWRQREDQPSVASVHGRKSEDLPEKRAISRRIHTVYDYMGAKDHPVPPSLQSVRLQSDPVSNAG